MVSNFPIDIRKPPYGRKTSLEFDSSNEAAEITCKVKNVQK